MIAMGVMVAGAAAALLCCLAPGSGASAMSRVQVAVMAGLMLAVVLDVPRLVLVAGAALLVAVPLVWPRREGRTGHADRAERVAAALCFAAMAVAMH